jgi:hypothetical protein
MAGGLVVVALRVRKGRKIRTLTPALSSVARWLGYGRWFGGCRLARSEREEDSDAHPVRCSGCNANRLLEVRRLSKLHYHPVHNPKYQQSTMQSKSITTATASPTPQHINIQNSNALFPALPSALSIVVPRHSIKKLIHRPNSKEPPHSSLLTGRAGFRKGCKK